VQLPSDFVDEDQADSEDVTVLYGLIFSKGVEVSDRNQQQKCRADMAQKPKEREHQSEPKVPSLAARTRSAKKTGNQ
jgi:hypothetical protein